MHELLHAATGSTRLTLCDLAPRPVFFVFLNPLFFLLLRTSAILRLLRRLYLVKSDGGGVRFLDLYLVKLGSLLRDLRLECCLACREVARPLPFEG